MTSWSFHPLSSIKLLLFTYVIQRCFTESNQNLWMTIDEMTNLAKMLKFKDLKKKNKKGGLVKSPLTQTFFFFLGNINSNLMGIKV